MTRFKLVFSEAVRSIGANLSTSIAATMTVLIGMFLLGLSIALGSWVVSWSDHVKSQLEVQGLLRRRRHRRSRSTRSAPTSAQDTRIKEYQFVSKTEALKRMRKKYPQLTANLPSNPLPASFEVTPQQRRGRQGDRGRPPRRRSSQGVEKVKDGQQTSKRILQVGKWIWIVFLVMVIVLLIASVILIANTIRLSIFSRRREIEVMKLVGATNWFVRGPFMLEGLLCGLVGSIAAVAAAPPRQGDRAARDPRAHRHDRRRARRSRSASRPLALLAVGLGVGALGSGMTLRGS